MSKVMVTESYLDDIADAIRAKNGLTDTYKPSEMAEAISELGGATLGSKTITENDTYYASSDDLDGYSSVTVNVPNPSTGTISITSNGTVDVTQYASAEVDVPQGITPTGTLSITQNGTVDVTNYASASVAVPNPSTGTKQISITQNGTTTENVADYASAEITVAVSPNVGTKSITSNGTYNASSDSLDGYSQVTVNVPSPVTKLFEFSVDLEEYTSTTVETTSTGHSIDETEYEHGYYTITCDSAITTSTEWGMTVGLWSRTWNASSSNTGKLMTATGSYHCQKGTATLLQSLITVSPAYSNYGVALANDLKAISITRKANTNMPKIRAGKYTLKMYALTEV